MINESSVRGTMHRESLALIIQDIIRIADPEKILLLSACYDYQLTENIFIKTPIQEFTGSHYDVMILIADWDKKSLAGKDLSIITRLHANRNLKFCLMDIREFNERIRAGAEVENFIHLNAIICYDKGGIVLADPSESQRFNKLNDRH